MKSSAKSAVTQHVTMAEPASLCLSRGQTKEPKPATTAIVAPLPMPGAACLQENIASTTKMTRTYSVSMVVRAGTPPKEDVTVRRDFLDTSAKSVKMMTMFLPKNVVKYSVSMEESASTMSTSPPARSKVPTFSAIVPMPTMKTTSLPVLPANTNRLLSVLPSQRREIFPESSFAPTEEGVQRMATVDAFSGTPSVMLNLAALKQNFTVSAGLSGVGEGVCCLAERGGGGHRNTDGTGL